MITKFKIFEKITKWEFDDDKYIYHYTGEKAAIKIIEDGFLRIRPQFLYTKDPDYEHDYGYVSFTESDCFHWETHGIDTDCRFVFDKEYMNNKYDFKNFDANKEAEEIYYSKHGDMNDLQKQEIPFYNEEYEIRVYENIPISDALRLEKQGDPYPEMIDFCKTKNIKLGKFL